MGDIVPLFPDPADEAYIAEVCELTWLARIPGRADLYIRRRTPTAEVLSDCILAVFGKRLPRQAARAMVRLTGRAGTARHALPIHPGPHGTRRKPP